MTSCIMSDNTPVGRTVPRNFHNKTEMVYARSCHLGNSGRSCSWSESLSPRLTLELCEELLDCVVPWAVSYKQLPSDQQELLGLWMAVPRWLDNILFEGRGRETHPCERETSLGSLLHPTYWGSSLILGMCPDGIELVTFWCVEQGSTSWATPTRAMFGFLLTHGQWPMANGLTIWSGRKAVKTWLMKGLPIWAQIVLWKSL